MSNVSGSATATHSWHFNCNPPSVTLTSVPPPFYYWYGTATFTTSGANLSLGRSRGTWRQ